MNTTGQTVQKHVERPTHPVPRKYVEPIMFLADHMAQLDKITPPPGRRMVDQLADALQLKDFRRQPSFRLFNDQKACDMLDLETVKLATLVVLTLVLKADTTRGEAAKGYFSKVRQMLDMEPVAVPAELDAHRTLAMSFMVG